MEPIQPSEADPEDSQYIQTEFFFYMLTCYYAIVAFSIRYSKIMKDPPDRNVNRLMGEFLITCLENQPQFVPGAEDSPPPASYVIKSKFCLINSYLYLFMFLFSLIGTEDLFYGCKHRKYSIIYLFGFVAWEFAAIVLRREYQRELNQSLWTHRIFWIFSGTFAITKMFEDYLLPMNMALNCISIATNFILAIYGIYRPDDNDTITLIDNEDIPGIIKLFLENIELNPTLRKALMIEEPTSNGLKETIDPENVGEIDMNALEQALKVTAQSRREEINLLNELPRRNIFIDKKLQYHKNTNGTIKVCYFVFSQIGNKRFEASRTYKEFLKVEEELGQTFNEKNFPKVSLPKIKKSDTAESSNQCEVLEEWLVEVVKKPLFLTKPLLTFLNIDEESSAPFLTYFEVSYKSFCSNAFMVAQLRKKEARTSRVSLVGYYEEEENTNTSSTKISTYIKEKLEFLVEVDEEITESNEFGFLMTCIRESKKKERIRWKLRKYEENILQVNYRIEEECKTSISFYYKMISQLGNKNHKLKALAYKEYLQKLMDDDRFYCVSLFQFIRFDPIEIEAKVAGMGTSFSKAELEGEKKRLSHYFQDFEDKGEIVNVIRVDRESENLFKFKIRRKSFVQFRTSAEILKLRKDLAEIYQGVCFIPDIGYEDCNKAEAKERTEKFLTALESLPKITVNERFGGFYEHTI